MPRGFAEGHAPASPDQLREWYMGEMVSRDGEILCDEAHVLLREFVDTPNATISAVTLARRLFMDPYQTRSLCRQLVTHEILEESPPLSARFRLVQDDVHGAVLANIASHVRRSHRKAA